jgi:hypothetical protein
MTEMWQQHVANRLGVAEELIRRLRRAHLREGEDYRREGQRIIYEARGVERLRELIQQEGTEKAEEGAVDGSGIAGKGDEGAGGIAQCGEERSVLREREPGEPFLESEQEPKAAGDAGWKPAIQQIGNLRYGTTAAKGLFLVIRCLPNPHYVSCVAVELDREKKLVANLTGKELVQVRVRDNGLVRPRMILECEKEASGWVCPKVPRRML